MAIKPMKTLNFGGEDTYLLKPDWDDVDNRPFYEEPPTETMLVDNATIELVDMNGDGSIGISQNPFTMEIAEGVEYTITWNGDVYTATGCVDADGLPYVGNYAIATGMNDTGEPFLLIDLSAFGMGFGVYSTIIGLATISVSATISNIHTIDPKFLPKPLQFGEKFEYGTIFPEQTLALGEAGEGMYAAQVECPNIISPGRTYDVTYNGTKYSSTATLFDGIGCIGNLSLLGFGADTGEPFFAGAADGILIFYATDSSATLSIEGDVAIVTQIDEKFVPERDYSEIYAAKSHNHDSSYAAKSHNHDSSYAAKSHNHDSSYAAKSHNHDSDYADINHNHDEDYAALDHTHSYNDLEDKLVGYIPSDTLTWDGDTTGLIHVDGTGAYKVSDKTPTKDEVLNAGGSYTTIYKGEKQVTEITSTSIMVFNDQIYSIGSNIIVVSVDGATCTGLTFPMAGIYFTLTNDIFIPSLTINGIELGRRTKQLDNKYLPSHLQFGEIIEYTNSITWDGSDTDINVTDDDAGLYYICGVSPDISVDDIVGGTLSIYMRGKESIGVITEESVAVEDGIITLDGVVDIVTKDNMPAPDGITIFPKAGLYFFKSLNGDFDLHIAGITAVNDVFVKSTEFKQLDNKYLEPFETVGGDTITWDGNTEGLESVDLGGAMLFYKVSSATPALEDFANGGKFDFFDDGVAEITQDMLTTNNGAIFDTEMTFVIAHENEMGLSKGVWFNGAITPIALTINGYTGFTTTKLKEEYIPVDYIKQLIAEVIGK